jgi:cobalt-zinc-cadmium efflux system membrane fusion protein
VPEALCYQCNAALVPAFKATGDWCAGHDRPESQCYICNPELDPNRKATSTDQSNVPASGEQGVPEGLHTPSHLPRTQSPPAVFCTTNSLVVHLENAEIVRNAGLEMATVESRPITKTLECNAEVTYDGNRYAQLASQVPGIIATVQKDLGEQVSPGDVMATIRSAHLGAAKGAYLQALAGVRLWEKNHARANSLLEKGFTSEREMLETETSLAESRIELSETEQGLLSLGLSTKQIQDVARTGDTSAHYAVTASFPGIVVARHAVVGEVVDPSTSLFAVADISRMWALLDVYESDAREIRAGQPVVLRVEGLRGENFGGIITWVSAQIDPQTRTLQARAELDNSHGYLRANMFAQAIVSVREGHEAVVVPQAAVQWEGCCNVVFVKKSETVYEPRKVHLGSSTGTVYEVLSGVKPGEEIVTQGSFLLKTEILKGSIGAGCCEVQPGT